MGQCHHKGPSLTRDASPFEINQPLFRDDAELVVNLENKFRRLVSEFSIVWEKKVSSECR